MRNAIDLSHEGFRDVDWMGNYGNDGFLGFTLERPFRVKIVLSHYTMGFIHLILDTFPNGLNGISEPVFVGFFSDVDNLKPENSERSFDEIDKDPECFMEFDLGPGIYQIQVQCTKGSNAGTPNKLVYYHVIGSAL